jgi:hypothetical protein
MEKFYSRTGKMNILRLLGTIHPNLFWSGAQTKHRGAGMNAKWAVLAFVFPFKLLVVNGNGQQHLPTTVELTHGKSLYRACTNEFPAEPYGEAVCVSYFEGFEGGQSSTGAGLCVENVSYGDMASAYIKYAKRHPEILDKDKRAGVILALGQAYPCPAKPNETMADKLSNDRLKKIELDDYPIDAQDGMAIADGMWLPESDDPKKSLVFPEQVKITCMGYEKICREMKITLGPAGGMVSIMGIDETDWPIVSWDERGLLASYGPDQSATAAASDKCHSHILTMTFRSGAVSTSDIPTHEKGCEEFPETGSYRLVRGDYYIDTTPRNDMDKPHGKK